MTILAFEFSTAQRSVAARTGGAGRGRRPRIFEAIETGGRATNAFGMIESVLAGAGIEREEVGVIAVGLGPGSYTGVRAAISIAQGWQLARGVRLIGVGSMEAAAAQAQAEGLFGRVSVVVDSQRDEFYLAAFEISETGWREIEPLKIVTRMELAARAAAGERLAGPEMAERGGTMLFPRAARLAELAGRREDFAAGEGLTPIYLRETAFVKAAAADRFT